MLDPREGVGSPVTGNVGSHTVCRLLLGPQSALVIRQIDISRSELRLRSTLGGAAQHGAQAWEMRELTGVPGPLHTYLVHNNI